MGTRSKKPDANNRHGKHKTERIRSGTGYTAGARIKASDRSYTVQKDGSWKRDQTSISRASDR